MAASKQALLKIFSPRIIAMAVETFDRATLLVMAICWAVFLIMMVFAIYTLRQTSAAHRDSEAALVAEPRLPEMARQTVDKNVAQTIIERLQHLYPDVTFNVNGANSSIVVSAIDAGKFHEWLTSLSYIDTVFPEYRWRITDMCIGKCAQGPVMQATMAGEKATFSLPQ